MQDINILGVKPAEDNSPKRLPAGGYIMHVVEAIDHPEERFLELLLDVSSGEWANYGQHVEERNGGNWGYPKLRAYYRENSLPQFRRMLDLFERENERFTVGKFNNDESKLVGLKIGVVLDEDDYNDYFSLKPNYFKLTTIENIAYGKYRVKRLSGDRKAELERLAEQRKADKQAKNSPATSSGIVIPFD